MTTNNSCSMQPRSNSSTAEILDEAIAWAVRLGSGMAGEDEHAACRRWRAAATTHEHAWRQVQSVEQEFHQAAAKTGSAGRCALHLVRVDQGRRRMLKVLGIGAAGLVTGLLAQYHPWEQHPSYMAATGRQLPVSLSDGTRILLNTDSEFTAVFSPLRRLIVLKRGEIAINTGLDSASWTGRRSFWVETAQAQLEAIGTEFIVRQLEDETRLHVTGGAVAIHQPGVQPVVARVGDSFAIRGSAGTLKRVEDETFDATAWRSGALVAKRMRLDAFAAELSRYRQAPIVCAPDAASLQVSGVFQLCGKAPAERALKALQAALPVRIVHAEGGTTTLHRQ